MGKRLIIIILYSLIIVTFFSQPAFTAQEKKLNLLGQEICPNSAGALLRDELSGMDKEDALIVIIETDRKDIIQAAIKLEKLPVNYEEKDEKDIATFIIRLK